MTSTKCSESKRNRKARSLLVPLILSENDDSHDDSCNVSRSPSLNRSFRSPFSLREFRRGRSLSKCRYDDDADNDNISANKCDKTSLYPESFKKSSSLIDLKGFYQKFQRTLSSGWSNYVKRKIVKICPRPGSWKFCFLISH